MANVTNDGMEAECNVERCGSPAAGWGQPVRWGISFLLLMGVTVACTVVYQYVRDQVHSRTCGFGLFQIGLALRSYHMQYGAFPPAYSCDKTGQPVNSWRTLIVPDRLWYTFPTAYDFAERWDGPKNSALFAPEIRKGQHVFQCPSAGWVEAATTNYVAVVGPTTMWPGCDSAKQAADGSDNDKILVIEVIHSDILWMEPQDLTLEQALDAIQPTTGVGIGSQHKDGIRYVTVGGEVRTLDHSIDRESLRKLLVREGRVAKQPNRNIDAQGNEGHLPPSNIGQGK